MDRHRILISFALLGACAAERGVCGDGVVDADEACDAASAGCDATCHLTGATAWTRVRGEAYEITRADAVAVAADGQIVVLGYEWAGGDPSAWLLGLDAAGAEQWRTAVTPPRPESWIPPRVEIAADGGVYHQSDGLIRLDPDGRRRWEVSAGPGGAFTAITTDGDDVYAAWTGFIDPSSDGPPAVGTLLRRLDPDTGALAWEAMIGDAAAFGFVTALAVTGDTLVAVGPGAADLTEDFGLVCVAAATGAAAPCTSDRFHYVVPAVGVLADGDLVVAHVREDRAFLRRFTLGGGMRWDVALDVGDLVMDVAVGPDDTVVVAGEGGRTAPPYAFVRSFSPDGAVAWDAKYRTGDPGGRVAATGVAFGPGFLVAAGLAMEGSTMTAWIRELGPT